MTVEPPTPSVAALATGADALTHVASAATAQCTSQWPHLLQVLRWIAACGTCGACRECSLECRSLNAGRCTGWPVLRVSSVSHTSRTQLRAATCHGHVRISSAGAQLPHCSCMQENATCMVLPVLSMPSLVCSNAAVKSQLYWIDFRGSDIVQNHWGLLVAPCHAESRHNTCVWVRRLHVQEWADLFQEALNSHISCSLMHLLPSVWVYDDDCWQYVEVVRFLHHNECKSMCGWRCHVSPCCEPGK